MTTAEPIGDLCPTFMYTPNEANEALNQVRLQSAQECGRNIL